MEELQMLRLQEVLILLLDKGGYANSQGYA